jgi:CO/xanthine dehydrogenase FAD-binding subunit
MRPLSYLRVRDVDDAVQAVAADPGATFLAGGTTEIDLIRRVRQVVVHVPRTGWTSSVWFGTLGDPA